MNTENFKFKPADVINFVSEIFQMEKFFPPPSYWNFFFPFSLFSLPLPFFYFLLDDVLHRFLHRKWLKDLLTEEETHVGSNLLFYRNFSVCFGCDSKGMIIGKGRGFGWWYDETKRDVRQILLGTMILYWLIALQLCGWYTTLTVWLKLIKPFVITLIFSSRHHLLC